MIRENKIFLCLMSVLFVSLSACRSVAVGDDDSEFVYVESGLPHIFITVASGEDVLTKEYYDATISVDGAGVYDDMSERDTEIKGRGNSTWLQPKKPYKLKLGSKASMLGLKAEKDWVLLANHLDPSLMINAMAMRAGQMIGVEYCNNMIPVDITINGEYRGSYTLTEQVEIKENRVNLSDDGYILELDSYFDEDLKEESTILQLPVMLKDADEETQENFNNIMDEFNAMEAIVMASDFPANNYKDYIDIESVAKYLLVNQLMRNNDITVFPRSLYMYKDAGAKFKLGPIWDFDHTCGRTAETNFDIYTDDIMDTDGKGAQFLSRFFMDSDFVDIYNDLWADFMANHYSDFMAYIDEYADVIAISARNDNEYWGRESFDTSVESLRAWFINRVQYLNDNLF